MELLHPSWAFEKVVNCTTQKRCRSLATSEYDSATSMVELQIRYFPLNIFDSITSSSLVTWAFGTTVQPPT
jgi:hypothetical protein